MEVNIEFTFSLDRMRVYYKYRRSISLIDHWYKP
jgi:hypothetical protein